MPSKTRKTVTATSASPTTESNTHLDPTSIPSPSLSLPDPPPPSTQQKKQKLNPKQPPKTLDTHEMHLQLLRIASSNRTPFEKRVWTALCQVPKGQVTTYGLLAEHLSSAPRAVGNALRRNPFAPEVPCHRVVATGGTLGGFKGKWPRDGEGITLDEKRMLLRREGVRFDSAGRVLGTPFRAFGKE